MTHRTEGFTPAVRVKAPCLLLMKGSAGTGKSTIARALAGQLGWPLIDKDDVKDMIDGQAPDAGRLAYAVMFQVARRQLDAGQHVICDSPLSYSSLYAEAKAIAATAGATVAVLATSCPDEAEWQRRIDQRKTLNLPAHHQTDWHAFQPVRSAWEASAAYPIDAPILTVDTTRPLDKLVSDAAGWLHSLAGAAPRLNVVDALP